MTDETITRKLAETRPTKLVKLTDVIIHGNVRTDPATLAIFEDAWRQAAAEWLETTV